MSDETPDVIPKQPRISSWFQKISSGFSKQDLTLALAAFAAILALAPYFIPSVQMHFVRQGLVKHPELLESAALALNKQKQDKENKRFQVLIKANESILISPHDDILGDPKAPITFVEFSDYYCSYCKLIAPDVERILAKNKDVRFVIKQYPIIHKNSRLLSAMVLSAKSSGRFTEIHHSLFTNPLTTEAEIYEAFAKVGLDGPALLKQSQDTKFQSQIDQNLLLGERLNFNATPMFIINGNVVAGAKPDELNAEIIKARKALKSKP